MSDQRDTPHVDPPASGNDGSGRATERDEALGIAHRVLDRCVDSDEDIAALARQLLRANERAAGLHILAKETGDALMSFTPGGSEYFVQRFGDYYADAAFCKRRVHDKFEMMHNTIKGALLREKAAKEALASEYERGVAAGERSGIEKAAKVAENDKSTLGGDDGWARGYATACDDIAKNIRALNTGDAS